MLLRAEANNCTHMLRAVHAQDTVTPTGQGRATITAIAVLTAVLVLLPMAPELAEAFGIGPADRFLF